MELIRSSDDSIQIVIRVRPFETKEVQKKCLDIRSTQSLELQTRPLAKEFNFDYIADENTSQVRILLTIII